MGVVKVTKLSELPVGVIKQFKVKGIDDIAVANVGGKIYAMRGKCNHLGGPLGEGKLEGKIVTCPWHGAKFDITTGKFVEFHAKLKDEQTYKVIVDGDDISIDI